MGPGGSGVAPTRLLLLVSIPRGGRGCDGDEGEEEEEGRQLRCQVEFPRTCLACQQRFVDNPKQQTYLRFVEIVVTHTHKHRSLPSDVLNRLFCCRYPELTAFDQKKSPCQALNASYGCFLFSSFLIPQLPSSLPKNILSDKLDGKDLEERRAACNPGYELSAAHKGEAAEVELSLLFSHTWRFAVCLCSFPPPPPLSATADVEEDEEKVSCFALFSYSLKSVMTRRKVSDDPTLAKPAPTQHKNIRFCFLNNIVAFLSSIWIFAPLPTTRKKKMTRFLPKGFLEDQLSFLS